VSQIITIGYIVEGSTDVRFLENIIRRTFEDIALLCEREIEIYSVISIKADRGNGFVAQIQEAIKDADKQGIEFVCVHCDADDRDDVHVQEHKIIPAFEACESFSSEKNIKLLSLIPVYMTEAWMLADTSVFKDEISSRLDDHALGIDRVPESYNDPKKIIKEAIRISQQGIARRRQKLDIADLYSPLGQKISLDSLKRLPSYQKFFQRIDELLRYD
jgi:hypothetical protein